MEGVEAMSNISQGWQAYRQGNFEEARRHFGANEGFDARAGEALSLLASGRGQEAIALVERAGQQDSDLQYPVLLADLVGRQGNRKEAEQRLDRVLRVRPTAGFILSLRGEQRVRQGNWEKGTEDFIAAMEHRTDQAFSHIQHVVADMVDAVAARRIPATDAMRLVNRIDYSSGKKTQEVSSYFAAARRALNATRRMEREGLVDPWSVGTMLDKSPEVETPPVNSQSPAQPRNQAVNRGQVPPARLGEMVQPSISVASSSFPASGSADSSSSPAQLRRQRQDEDRARDKGNQKRRRQEEDAQRGRGREMQRRLAQRQTHEPHRSRDELVESQLRDMTAALKAERQLNECLQDIVAQTPPQVWPSEIKSPIDNVPPIGFSSSPILRGSSKIANSNFRITGGDLGVQITLERCMHNLMAAAHALKPVALPTAPQSIGRVELNLQDNFLETMPSLESLYLEETPVQNEKQLGIGKFIGECIVQCYGGTWHYHNPPETSMVNLGSHRLEPMKLAGEFLKAKSFDDVDLRALIDHADEAVRTSTSLPTFRQHIDPTPGLEIEALVMSLAQLWADYRFDLADTAVPQIAPTMEILDRRPRVIVFGLGRQFVPPAILEDSPGSVISGKAIMAYDRRSGEFLVLASRKHFARMLRLTQLTLDAEGLPEITSLLPLFRPAWKTVIDRESAQEARELSNSSEIVLPEFRERDQESGLRLQACDEEGVLRQIVLRYRPDHISPYALSVT